MEMDELNTLLASVKDENLKLVLPFGIGMHHAGLSAHERAVVEQVRIFSCRVLEMRRFQMTVICH